VGKISKKRKDAESKVDKNKAYNLSEAFALLKDVNYAKFDASVDLDIRLGVDPRQANQMVRGSVTLPHGTGKTARVLVLCNPDKEEEARAAGADHVGLDDYIEKIQGGWTDIDVIVTQPSAMAKVGRLGRILGPRGLMPNPKTGTVTDDITKAVTDVKGGKIDFKVDKYGILHNCVGRISFTPEQLVENSLELIKTVVRAKPSGAKGTYVKSVFTSSTMSPGIRLDVKSLTE
jgi:large subunit ribosomal protein L1